MFSSSRHDIIEKLLTDIMTILAKLMGWDTSAALEEIQEYYKSWLGLNRNLLQEYTPQGLLDFLLQEKQFSTEKLELLAYLLHKEGEILIQDQQISVGKDQLQKALVIFGYVEEKSTIFSLQRRATITNINELLSNN